LIALVPRAITPQPCYPLGFMGHRAAAGLALPGRAEGAEVGYYRPGIIYLMVGPYRA
jgi:hypothetical protein